MMRRHFIAKARLSRTIVTRINFVQGCVLGLPLAQPKKKRNVDLIFLLSYISEWF